MEIERHEMAMLAYHVQALEIAMQEFIKRAPAFQGDGELAAVMGTQIADIQSWLKEHK